MKLETEEEVPAHLGLRDPCPRAGPAPSTPDAGRGAYQGSPEHPLDQDTPLPTELRDSEEELEVARSMGEQEAMDDESVYAPSSPAREDDQDMGLLSAMEVCPVLDQALCEDELEELNEVIEETCVLSAMLGDTRKGFRARAKTHTTATVAEFYIPPRVTRAATLLPSLGIELGAALDITTCDECGKP